MCWHVAAARATSLPTRPASVEFVRNDGQWPAVVRFAAPLANGQLFLEDSGFTYALTSPRPHHLSDDDARPVPPRGHAYRVRLEGSLNAPPVGEQPTPGRHNYFRGDDPAQWASDVPGFRAVAYPEVYPGVGLRLYENAAQQLEYTFTVQPGGRPAAIALRYDGATTLALDAEGNLRIATSVGTVTELAPRAWQTDAAGQQQPVPCAFEVAGNSVRFRLGAYDAARQLVIDPAVVFATFSGATADNWGHTATYDAQGNFYSAGTVFEPGYPTSLGAFDPSFNGSVDVAIIKYNPAATGAAARVYATYLGGAEADVPHRLVTDAQGELVIFGTTSSANFPVTVGTYDSGFNGGPAPQTGTDDIAYRRGADLFLVRLSGGGNQLRGSTYLGGTGTDGFAVASTPVLGGPPVLLPGTSLRFLGDVQLDAAGNVCVATATDSRDFPAVAAYATTYRGGRGDAVVCQLSPDLRQLRWSTFLGGNDADAAFALVPDRQGGLYAVGGTRSPDFPFSAGAYQSGVGGSTDGFVAHLSSNGRVLLAASRLGTALDDVVRLVQLDAAGNVLVLGQSLGLMTPTPGHYGEPGRDFLQQLSPDLRQSQFTAIISASSATYPMPADIALGVDECDRIYVATMAYPDQVIGVPLAATPVGTRFFYALRLSAGARALEYATALPGEHVHGASRIDPRGNLYLAVCGNCEARYSLSLPAGVNTFSAHTATGKCNDASLKIDLSPAASGNAPARVVCANAAPLLLGGSPAGGTWTGPGVGPAPGGGYQFVPSAILLGQQVLTYTPPGGSVCPATSQSVIVAAPTPITVTPVGPYCYSTDFTPNTILSAQPAGGFFSGPGVTYSYLSAGTYRASFSAALAGPGAHTITYTLNQNGQCGTATQVVTVRGARIRLFPADTAFCGEAPRPFQVRATPAGGVWSGPSISPTGYWTPPGPGAPTGPATYTYTSPDGCVARQNLGVRTYANVAPNAVINLPVCANFPDYTALAPATLSFPAQSVYASYYWDYGDGTFSGSYVGSIPAQTHTYEYPGTYTATLSIQYGIGCTKTLQIAPIVVGPSEPLPNIITPNADGLNETFVQQQFCEAPALHVFSRWGQEVYRTAHYRNDWAAPGLPNCIYYYRLLGEQGRAAKGWLEVRR
jgi:hypothetical protein